LFSLGGYAPQKRKTHNMQIARCSCGNVEIETVGIPIASAVCYCDSCQEGSRQIEALTNAVPILDPDGGTAYVLYRKDRIKYLKGAELLKGYKLEINRRLTQLHPTAGRSDV
jgi:hypothetical protein